MFDEVQSLVQKVTTGETDSQSVQQAAQQHVGSMSGTQITQHLQTAADNANQAGQTGIAQQLMGLISQHGSDTQTLQQKAISLISSNPQILQHFEPEFAKGILNRI